MSTIIRDRELIAILKGANVLAREIIDRHPHLFGEPQPANPPVAEPGRQAEAESEAA